MSRITLSMLTLLPDPDSPTMHSTSSAFRVRHRSCTTVTEPCSVRIDTSRCWTSSRGCSVVVMSPPPCSRVQDGVHDIDDGVHDDDRGAAVQDGGHDDR